MDAFKNLQSSYYINNPKRLIPYVPEKTVEMLRYDRKLWSTRFPSMGNINYKKLQLTNVGIYSIAKPYISQALITMIKELLVKYNLDDEKNDIVITETNGGVGGFSIRLAREFDNLNIVEINPTHADIIKNNLEVYGFGEKNKKNIKIWSADYLEVFNEIKSDIIICDPPWGGYEYASKGPISLGFNNVDIACVIQELIQRNLFKIFILMTPHNFNFNKFVEKIHNDIDIRKIKKLRKINEYHYFIAVINIQ
jgi:predicted RNA methylase